MGAYTFDDPSKIRMGRIGGRKAFNKKFKTALIDTYGCRDAITGDRLHDRYLQIDHRIPYQISGESKYLRVEEFMLLDASSQRAKSWSCEHCENFIKISDPHICSRCFWAFPDDYDHIAMEQKRRAEIVWSASEVQNYDAIKETAKNKGISVSEYIKNFLSK